MSDLNVVALVGRVVEKPQVKYLKTGTAVSDLRIANNTYRKGEGNNNEKVNWLNVTVFGKQAENCEKYLDKGSQVVISGRLDYQQWEKDGQKRSMIKIIANSVQFVGGKRNNQDQYQQQPESQNQEPPQTETPQSEPAKSDPAPETETTSVDNQEGLGLNNEKESFDSTFEDSIGDDDDIPF